MKAELEKLVVLQNSDSQIKKLKNAISTVDQRRAVLEQEFEARAFEIRALEKTRDDANKEKLKIEAEIADAGTKLERAERNLKQAQNQKQYEAAMREKTVLQKQISDFETQVLEKSESVDAAEKVLTERADEIAGIEGERAAALQAFDTQLKKEKSQLKKVEENRAEAFATLPKNLASTYDRLVKRIRDGVAVAEVRNSACSACSMKLRPQMVVDIKVGGQIETCENCNRILYILPAETAQTA